MSLKSFLDQKVEQYENPAFIAEDPIALPHRFTKKQDIEIIGFWLSVLAWGRRSQIIKSGERLLQLMDNSPHDFILHHQELDRKAFLEFKHRTFQPDDAIYFLEWLQHYYHQEESLETAFVQGLPQDAQDVEPALAYFHDLFFSLDTALPRTRKHIADPRRGSSCKRLNMFLRWMVRPSDKGVDFGLWQRISPAQLLIPFDVHVERVAHKLGLLRRKQSDMKAVKELTAALRLFHHQDPVRYDFALFGMGVMEEGLD